MRLLSLLALSAASLAQEPKWPKGETDHYLIHSEAGEKLLNEYKVNMELLFSEYAKAFKFAGKLEAKAVVVIHADQNSYIRGGGSPASAAYYNPESRKLVSYANPELLQFLAHEATHQFFDLCFPEFFKNPDVPMWFNEGIAECFCNCRVQGKQLWINVLDGCENAVRNVQAVQDILAAGRLPDLGRMLETSREGFMRDAGVLYPVAWSFCHFLWNAPELSGKGVYREVVVRLVEAFKAGKNRKDAYAEAFVVGKKKLSLADLETEWRGYIKKLRARKPGR